MSTFFRGITETVPSLFRGIFSERNSVPNPSHAPQTIFDLCILKKGLAMPHSQLSTKYFETEL
jgi:hypothetical protein